MSLRHYSPSGGVKVHVWLKISARTLLSEVGAAASECGNSLGTPGTLFFTRPQALRIPSFVDRAIVAATPSACKYGVTACDRGKFPPLRVDSVCSVSPAASAGSFALCHCAIGVVFALGDFSLLCSQPGKLPLAFGPR